MSPMLTVMETVAKFVPDREVDPLIGRQGYVGQPVRRVDGALKVRGEARFSADHPVEGLAHAALVHATIAKGRIARIDASAATAAPGVIEIVTHANAPKLKRPQLLNVMKIGRGVAGSDLPILQDDTVSYDGEAVAIVVAETLEQAEHAATLVRIEYEADAPRTSFDDLKGEAVVPPDVLGEEPELEIGDAETALSSAAFRVDNEYRTPRHNHNAIELHATIATWHDDGTLTVFDGSQFVNGFKHQLATVFGLKPERIRVVSPFVGGAFGGKWAIWSNTVLCAAAARVVGRPVKLVLSREGVFRIIGGRTPSAQRVALGADPDGKLVALIHTGTTATTTHARYPEQFSLTARHLYAAPNLSIGQKIVDLDMVANTWTVLPDSPITAGGSSQTVTIAAAVQAAVEKAHRALLKLAAQDEGSPLAGARYDRLEARDGGLFRKGRRDAGAGESYSAMLRRAGKDFIEVEASSGMPLETRKYAMASYGAQFCEVRVHARTGEVRVARWLGSFDCGRIVNPQTAVSQFRGGIVMGIGMALSEQTLFDARRGRIMNRSLAEYHVPVHLDVPHIEVIYTDIPDPHAPLGAHGIGEIGITGAAAAVANAVFHATGKRVRDLPITLDTLM